MRRHPHGMGVPLVSEARGRHNDRYRMGQCRTGLESEGTVIGMAVSQRKEASKHNEASRSGSIAWSGMLLTQCKMANVDYFVQTVRSEGSM